MFGFCAGYLTVTCVLGAFEARTIGYFPMEFDELNIFDRCLLNLFIRTDKTILIFGSFASSCKNANMRC